MRWEWAVPRLCDDYPGICLTTEEKARRNISQVLLLLLLLLLLLYVQHEESTFLKNKNESGLHLHRFYDLNIICYSIYWCSQEQILCVDLTSQPSTKRKKLDIIRMYTYAYLLRVFMCYTQSKWIYILLMCSADVYHKTVTNNEFNYLDVALTGSTEKIDTKSKCLRI